MKKILTKQSIVLGAIFGVFVLFGIQNVKADGFFDFPSYDMGTTYPTYDMGTTYPTYDMGTTYPTYDMGTTYPTYDMGTTYPTYDMGTTYPTYDRGTTYPTYNTGTSYPVYDTGYPTYNTGTSYPVYDTGYPTYNTGTSYPVYNTGYPTYTTPTYTTPTYTTPTYTTPTYRTPTYTYPTYTTPTYTYPTYTTPTYTYPTYTTPPVYTPPIIPVIPPVVTSPPVQCPPGTTLVNNVCQPPVVTQPPVQCPPGTTLINGSCQYPTVNPPVYPPYYPPTTPPVSYQTCWDGSTIPLTAVCPAQYKTCPNGSSIPINQTCYYVGNNPAPVRPPEVIVINNVITSIVTEITMTSGRCNGIGLIPNGANSQGWFEYGETPNLGRQTAQANIGSASVSPFSNVLANLKPSTTYYCRAVMQNQYGLVKGEIVSFVTKSKMVKYVKPVTKTTTKVTTTKTKVGTKVGSKVTKNEVICNDGTTSFVKSASSAAMLNSGDKLIVLQIEKSEGALMPNGLVSYRLTYKNLSDSPISGVIIKISIPQEVQFTQATAGMYDQNTRVLTFNPGVMAPYSEGTVAISGRIMGNAQVGKSIVASASVVYLVPDTDTQDEVTTYVVGTIVNGDGVIETKKVDTGAKKVIGVKSGSSFLPNTLVEWLAFITIVLIIFILIRSIYGTYRDEHRR